MIGALIAGAVLTVLLTSLSILFRRRLVSKQLVTVASLAGWSAVSDSWQ